MSPGSRLCYRICRTTLAGKYLYIRYPPSIILPCIFDTKDSFGKSKSALPNRNHDLQVFPEQTGQPNPINYKASHYFAAGIGSS